MDRAATRPSLMGCATKEPEASKTPSPDLKGAMSRRSSSSARSRLHTRLSPDTQALLQRTCGRIERFAKAQLSCLSALDVAIPVDAQVTH